MFKSISVFDKALNSFTMYHLMLYALRILVVVSLLFSLFGLISYSIVSLVTSFLLLSVACYLSNWFFSKVYKAPASTESYAITALILFFILAPVSNLQDVVITVVAGVFAMGSKYVFAINRTPIFNPAAFAAVLIGLLGFGNAIWWVGSAVLLPFVFLIGFVIVRKVRKFSLFFSFFLTAVIVVSIVNLTHGLSVIDSITQSFISWPILFLGTIMVTEPATVPPRKNVTLLYGLLIGIVFGLQFHVGPLSSSPEFALIVGNIFSYFVSKKKKYLLLLQEKKKITATVYDFIFQPNEKIAFLPGQYMEWIVPHRQVDSRGNKRYFTIASSPTEQAIHLGIKVSLPKGSSYKKALVAMDSGQRLLAGSIVGDFILPSGARKKLVFIAGGIGITPFRSMIKCLIDKGEQRDIVLFYACSQKDEFVYQEIFSQATSLGVQTVFVLTSSIPNDWQGEQGRIDQTMIQKYVYDISERLYYLSGPDSMVSGYRKVLLGMGVSRKNIITDYFSGY
jgi:glycine betaine catabolism B